jgi:sigma-B regulation protein RsbU (phosphoserine phosphatase)
MDPPVAVAEENPGPPELSLEDSARDLFDNAPCGYLSTVPDGTIVRVNQTLLTWLGYERGELVGRRLSSLLGAGDQIYYETHYAPLLRMQGEVREIAVDLVRADGTRLPVLLNAVLRTDAGGVPVAVRATVFDATDRRAYERELLRARRAAEESEERARELARILQQSLIPPALPEIPGLDVAALYRPAGHGDEVGGDFYDVFQTGRDDWVIVLGDVRGKGAVAAAVTALIRHTIRAAAIRVRRPRIVLTQLNTELLRQREERFCTIVYARVRRDRLGRFRITVTAAGHPLPLRHSGRLGPGVIGRPGTLLGVVPSPRLYETSTLLSPGDAVLFYTDGVTEARHDKEFFGEDRLAATFAAGGTDPAATTVERIGTEVTDFQHGLPRDDIALLVLRVPDPAPEAAPPPVRRDS